jgi:predicted metalloprotease with PDZ domain
LFLVISGIWEGSPADFAAIGVGDRILVINGVKTPAKTEAYWRVILHDDKIKTLDLVVENSAGIRTITLKKCNLFAVHRVKTLKR